MSGPTELVVTSPANPRLRAVAALRNRRERDRTGTTRVEGLEEVWTALSAGVVPHTVFHCPELAGPGGSHDQLIDRASRVGVEIIRCSRMAFEKASYREGPDGVLAVVDTPGRRIGTLDLPAGSLLLVCQGIEKPGNLGAMLRTADAAGVAAVIAADPSTDWGNPNVIRASKGAVFTLPVVSASTAETLSWCAENGYAIAATTPDAALLHTDSDLSGALAVAVGTEKHGLDEAVLAAARVTVRIPMAGTSDSLNAATAAAVVLFEAVRQRALS